MSLAIPILAALFAAAPAAASSERVTLSLNPGWKFVKADPKGAATAAFDDRAWATVSLPHTYNDVDTFDDWSLVGHRGERNQWSGRTWYRKTFTLPAAYRGRKVYLEIEAARQIAEVYLNGTLLGVNKTGFVPFGFDLTPHLKFGAPNVLAVMCDNRFMMDPLPAELPAPVPSPVAAGPAPPDLNIAPPAGPRLADLIHKMSADIPEDVENLAADQIPWNNPHWHPAHGGLYRNVRLYITDPLHISLPLYSNLGTVGPYVYASDITEGSARVTVEVPIQNGRATAADLEAVTEVIDASGTAVLTLRQRENVAAGGRATVKMSDVLPAPKLWAPDHPFLYRVVSTLRAGGRIVDRAEVPLGLRSVRWDTKEGFFINGRHLKLRGWGQKPTNEWPGLGAAQPDWMHFFTLQLMREAGGNFVRWGHCNGGPASLAAGDRLGLIADQPGLDGEADTHGAAWKVRAAAFRDLVVYFRNHPSILVWEGGNQKVSRAHAKELRGYMDTFDPHGGRAYAHRRADAITAEFMHIGVGTEGGREIKEQPVVEGEYDREEAPRRVWDEASPPSFGYHEAKGQTYQLTSEQFAVNQVAHFVKKLGAPDHAGGANWIFSDSTSGGRVATEVARASGEVDGVRLPKEAYFVCKAMFRDDPQVHLVGHWSYPTGTRKTVYVAANTEEVELSVNGKPLGRATPTERFLFTFKDVAFEPGEIKATAFVGGRAVAAQVKETAGPAVGLRITPITGPGGLQADGADVVLLDVEAVDAKGRRVPTFQQRVDFQMEGPGVWRGGYNSGKVASINRTDLELEAGINRVAVRSTLKAGTIRVRAATHGLEPGIVGVTSKPVVLQGGYTTALPEMPKVDPARPIRDATVAAPAAGPAASPVRARPATPPGQYATSLAYSGPTADVRIQRDVREGTRIYVDREWTFGSLPGALAGADHVQTAEADRLYHAVDLMEIAVQAGSVVSVAHDDRLARPEWLTRQFQPTSHKVMVDGQSLSVFQMRAPAAQGLTLGANTESREAAGHMYLVFVGPGG
jgi:beta-galactosidase